MSEDASSRAPLTPLAAWAFLWASAILFSLTANRLWFGGLVDEAFTWVWLEEILLASLAFHALLRPRSTAGVHLFAVAFTVHVGILLPDPPNHRLLHGLVALSLLAAALSARRLDPREILARALPAIRGLVILLYAAAFFAKLNGDFVDPGTSCATRFYDDTLDWVPWLPDAPAVRYAIIGSTLLVEGLLPVLLFFRRTRTAGIVLGLVFHLVLATDVDQSLVNFSSAMSALLVLFLPDRILTAPELPWRASEREKAVRAGTAGGFLVVIAAGLLMRDDPFLQVAYVVLRETLFRAWLVVIVLAVLSLLGAPVREEALRPRWTPLPALVLLLAITNAASPYLGLRTRSVFTMYSNLYLDASGSNHWLVPRSLDVLGALDDRATILESSDPRVTRFGNELPWFEVRRLASWSTPVEIRYRRRGTEERLRFPDDAEKVTAPPWLLRKLVVFHAYGDRGACYF